MDGLDLHTVVGKLNTIADFLSPCLSLANGHATDFITQKYWDSFIPRSIQDELLSLTKEQLNSLPCTGRLASWKQSSFNSSISNDGFELDSCQKDTEGEINSENNLNKCRCTANELQDQCVCSLEVGMHIKSDSDTQAGCKENSKSSQIPFSSIAEYCVAAEGCTIEGLGLAVTPDMLLEKFDVAQNDLFIGTFMSEKKGHEIEVMSKVCSSVARTYRCKLVIDFGSGKGYLGKHLSLLYKLPVLGIDAVDTNTQSAEQRSAVLNKQWRGLTRNAEHKLEGKKLSKKEKKLSRNKDTRNTGTCNKEENDSRSQTVDRIDSSNGASHELGDRESNSKTNIGINPDTLNNGVTTGKSNCDSFDKKSTTALQTNFVPCTCYIDKTTDFMQLADNSFPDLFSSNCIHKNSYFQSHSLNKDLNGGCHINSSKILDKKRSPVRECVDACDCSQDLCKAFSMKCTSKEESVCMKCTSNEESVCKKCTSNEESVCKKCTSNEESLCKKCTSNEQSVCMTKTSNEESVCVNSTSNEDINTCRDRLKLMLVGLHTCGNLASTSVELFVNNDQLSVLCNVGCCYHLIDERYAEDRAVKVQEASHKKSGFPLSTCLNLKKFSVGNTARNLASQAVYRVPEFEQLQGERFYPRALLEVLLKDIEGNTREPPKGLRGLEKKSQSTKDYLRRACDKLNISDKISDEMLDVYMSRYQHEIHRLAAFFQLKTVLAPCIESLIILDRVALLLEQDNIDKVYLVKMFDPVISPRCYAIVAIKK